MRFRIVSRNLNNSGIEKSEQKDTQTRQSSGNKYTKNNSFKQMVKNSYEFYLSIGKDNLQQQQKKVAREKEEKIKKLIKKQRIIEQRQQQKQLQNKANNKFQNHNKQKPKQKKPKRPHIEASRKSQRNKIPVSYTEPNIINNDQEIFDVLNISSNEISQQNNYGKIKLQENNEQVIKTKNKALLEKVQREQGKYQIGMVHEAILRVQKFIDEHLNFAHEIRQTKCIQLNHLLKYVKSHGFVTFDLQKFNLLTKINPYLYSFSDTDKQSQPYLLTFKLNGLQIDKRLESTRRRMTQVSVPQLFT